MRGATLAGRSEVIAIVEADSGAAVSYDQLDARVRARAERFESHEVDLAFLFAKNTIETVVDYLALRSLGTPVLLMDESSDPGRLSQLAAVYQPGILLGCPQPLDGFRVDRELDRAMSATEDVSRLESDVAVSVLLPTSGSTGNPKFVQLTDENLNINAADIVRSLGISEDDRGLQPLPLFYSYGLSILNSHLAVGATTVLTSASPLRPEFWEIITRESVSSIPGVPYSYAMFKRAGLFERDIAPLRYMTQAGGKLDRDSVLDFHAGLARVDKQFFVMYGQTEASPRMSVLPSDDLPDHGHTAGFALDHGKFSIGEPDSDGVGEVLYEGPNVMIGYAERRSDLGTRSLFGQLETGDLGHLDDDGRLAITGRLKRIAKLFGNRISLQDVETHFSFLGPVAAIEGTNTIMVFCEGSPEAGAMAAKELERLLKVPSRTIQLVGIEALPRNANGKVDYKGLVG